ncbi:mitochondrial carrier domain-containing protein [Dunaliella salina]|nr:mitochondrial carrier domain-containing protein [Dunaliella salina]KAF5838839.1 mitochondrial carrier domain-containing protein [Dunaliella salina]|eukprot:KAF5838837.1 mitochondrial carrier domain-containing protein [Dunaliella salina]
MSARILRQEGLASLTAGMAPSVARGLLYGGLRLGLYAPTKRMLVALQSTNPQHQQQAEQGLGLKIMAGSMSGCLAAAITNPTELLKTRLQAPNLKPEQTTTVGVLRAVVAADGVQGLWRGAIPGMARAATLTVSLLAQLASSMLTGLVTTTAANPMDVVKTIMYTSNKNAPVAQEQQLAAAVAAAPAGGGAHPGE